MKITPKGYEKIIDVDEIINYFKERCTDLDEFRVYALGSFETINFEGSFQFRPNNLTISISRECRICREVESFEEWADNYVWKIEISISKIEWIKILKGKNQLNLF
jgi:hypothetical protein